MNDEKRTNKILDNYEEKIVHKIYKKKLFNFSYKFKFFNKFGIFLKKLSILTISLLIVYFVFNFFVRPIKYSFEETKIAEKRVNLLIEQKGGELKDELRETMNYLKDYPEFYEKVVNNIQDIQINNNICKSLFSSSGAPAAIQAQVNAGYNPLKLQEANFNRKTLLLSPNAMRRYNYDSVELASTLIHESDHVEFLESGKFRRVLLFVKCNPLLNPHISIFSNVPSIRHRITTIEICAQKEEIRFRKQSNTKSGYELRNSILLSGFRQLFRY
ncbi:hypothetical protein KAI92_05100 [Candidatus Parcubacteria bacterium]|nr:hypothetical protein [Candidatus Parcubacteria bacterium]